MTKYFFVQRKVLCGKKILKQQTGDNSDEKKNCKQEWIENKG